VSTRGCLRGWSVDRVHLAHGDPSSNASSRRATTGYVVAGALQPFEHRLVRIGFIFTNCSPVVYSVIHGGVIVGMESSESAVMSPPGLRVYATYVSTLQEPVKGISFSHLWMGSPML